MLPIITIAINSKLANNRRIEKRNNFYAKPTYRMDFWARLLRPDHKSVWIFFNQPALLSHTLPMQMTYTYIHLQAVILLIIYNVPVNCTCIYNSRSQFLFKPCSAQWRNEALNKLIIKREYKVLHTHVCMYICMYIETIKMIVS